MKVSLDQFCDECQSGHVVVTKDKHEPGMLNYYCRNCGAEWLDFGDMIDDQLDT